MRKLTTLLLSCCLASWFTGVGLAGDEKDGDHDKPEANQEVNVNVWVEDGKLTIDTGHGKKEIELSELHGGGEIPEALLKGISLGGEGHDGKGQVRVKAKVLVLDDNGQRRVVHLGDDEAHDVWDVIMLHEGHHQDGDDEHHAEGHDDHHSDKTARIITKQLRLPGGKVELRFEGDGGHFSIPELGEHFLWMQRGEHSGEHDEVHAKMFRGGDYILGVELTPLSEMLRSHLGLADGVGVGVSDVIDDTPAEEAGLQQHDIIVSANGESLDGYEALVEVVESAGESNSVVTLTIIRAGERREVSVTPAKRQGAEVRREVIIKRITEDDDRDEDEGEDEEDDDEEDDDDESIDEIKEELKSLRKALKAIRKELGDRD